MEQSEEQTLYLINKPPVEQPEGQNLDPANERTGEALSKQTFERTPHSLISNGLSSTRPSYVNIPDDGHAPLWILATTERRVTTEQAGQDGKDAAKRVMQGTFQPPRAETAESTVEQFGERTIDLTNKPILLGETVSVPAFEHASNEDLHRMLT